MLWRPVKLTALGLLWALWLVVSGCDTQDPSEEAPVVHVYGWAHYFPAKILQQFTQETGIKVTYDVFDNNESLEAKLLMGGEDYDVVLPSASPFLARQIKAGIFQPIRKETMSNYGGLDPAVLTIVAKIDPGNIYGVPYLWGTSGLGYNKNLVEKKLGAQAQLDSWSVLLDPSSAAKLGPCGVSMSETPFDALAPALVYKGYDPNTSSLPKMTQALEILLKIRPYIRNFQTIRTPEDLLAGNLCLAQVWSGDMLQVQKKAHELCRLQGGSEAHCAQSPIVYFVPKEGGELWCDCLAVPKQAPHPKNAHTFINFLIRPDIAAQVTEFLQFANASAASKDRLPKALRDNPIIYPPQEVMDKLYVETTIPSDIERWRTRQWLRVKKYDA